VSLCTNATKYLKGFFFALFASNGLYLQWHWKYSTSLSAVLISDIFILTRSRTVTMEYRCNYLVSRHYPPPCFHLKHTVFRIKAFASVFRCNLTAIATVTAQKTRRLNLLRRWRRALLIGAPHADTITINHAFPSRVGLTQLTSSKPISVRFICKG
jgi:hypothetical protein